MKELMIVEQNTQVTFINEDLNKATQKIFTVGSRIQKNLYEIAYILAKVEERELYTEDGFKNTAEYAQKTFGFKKTMAYSLLKIGKDFTTSKHESILPHEKGNDFSVTQVEKCLPLKDPEKVIELVVAEEITPEMSAKEISQVIKTKLPPKKPKVTADTADTDNTDDSGQPEIMKIDAKDMNVIEVSNEIIKLLGKLNTLVEKEEHYHNIETATSLIIQVHQDVSIQWENEM